MARCLFAMAQSMAVPSPSVLFGSAPWATRMRTISGYPFWAARYSGVFPEMSGRSGSAP